MAPTASVELVGPRHVVGPRHEEVDRVVDLVRLAGGAGLIRQQLARPDVLRLGDVRIDHRAVVVVGAPTLRHRRVRLRRRVGRCGQHERCGRGGGLGSSDRGGGSDRDHPETSDAEGGSDEQ